MNVEVQWSPEDTADDDEVRGIKDKMEEVVKNLRGLVRVFVQVEKGVNSYSVDVKVNAGREKFHVRSKRSRVDYAVGEVLDQLSEDIERTQEK